jgi:hydrogenase large subunit
MATRINIDPVTRIEGHLRIDVEVEGSSVSKAWASCTMWRGIENIVLGRDPREAWLFTQRFCGVCTTVHAMASVRAVEDALKLQIPPNAQFIRNLILINHGLHDHIVHFYQLSALDWVDIMTIPRADATKAATLAQSLSEWTGNSSKELKAAQDKVKAFASSGQLGMFATGYWGHPAMKLPPEVNLIAFAHYLQALEYQRYALQVVGMLGGKTPHIQNLAVGGVQNAINLDSVGTLNMDRLYQLKFLMDSVIPFVQQVYFNDACTLAALYPEWMSYGAGVRNYLAVPDLPVNAQASAFDLPGGVIIDGNISYPKTLYTAADTEFRHAVTEDLTHAWYKGNEPQHPWKGETQPHYTDFQENGKYSWVKAPRYDGRPTQVGPLAQILVGYAQGHPLTKKWTDAALDKISTIGKRKVTINDLQSTMGRHVARAIRCAMLSELAQKHWEYLVTNISSGDTAVYNPPKFPDGEVEGVGTHEAPRGTLSHWVVLRNGRLSNYQAVVPTTWNASPRDEKGVPGPYETSLLGNPVIDPEKPLEVLRTVHSFDPCMACACHTYDPAGKPIATVKVL